MSLPTTPSIRAPHPPTRTSLAESSLSSPKLGSFPQRPHGGWLASTERAPRKPGKAAFGSFPISWHNASGNQNPVLYACTISHPSVGHLAPKIDLGEIIQFHFTFPFWILASSNFCSSRGQEALDKAISCCCKRNSYSLYEFPVNFQMTSHAPALHLDSVLCLTSPSFPYPITTSADGSPSEHFWAPGKGSSNADRSTHRQEHPAVTKFLLMLPAPQAPAVFFRATHTRYCSFLSSALL